MTLSPADAMRALPDGLRPLVTRVVEAADERSLPAYLVGGPVRDLLLGERLCQEMRAKTFRLHLKRGRDPEDVRGNLVAGDAQQPIRRSFQSA